MSMGKAGLRASKIFTFVVAAALSIGALVPHPAHAIDIIETPDETTFIFSFESYIIPDPENPGEAIEVLVLVDPTGSGISNLSISLNYNSSKYTFDPSNSGFLCQFGTGGSCPAASAAIGTFPITTSSTIFTPGTALSGSTVSLTNTASTVTLQYTPPSPITVSGDTNFYQFAFKVKEPFVINTGTDKVTYSNTGAGTDFTQTASSCTSTAQSCGSDTPVEGISFSGLVPVPALPQWALISLFALLLLAGTFMGAKWRGQSGQV